MSYASREEAVAALLERRAQRLARVVDRRQEDRQLLTHVALIELGGMVLGLPADHLLEIVAVPELIPLPSMGPAMAGLAQVRGDLVGVADLALLLDVKTTDPPGILVLVRGERGPLGLLAGSAVGFRNVYADELAEGFADSEERPAVAVTRDMVTVLDLPRLLLSERIVSRDKR